MSTADSLYQALMLDSQPSPAATVDFGLDGWGGTNPQEVYVAYKRAITSGKVSKDDLLNALGDGEALTELIGVKICTVWDELPDCD